MKQAHKILMGTTGVALLSVGATFGILSAFGNDEEPAISEVVTTETIAPTEAELPTSNLGTNSKVSNNGTGQNMVDTATQPPVTTTPADDPDPVVPTGPKPPFVKPPLAGDFDDIVLDPGVTPPTTIPPMNPFPGTGDPVLGL